MTPIGKADATCAISGYSGVYDADAHGASGTCAGVGGEDAGTLDLGDSFTDVPGGTANWSFTGNGNYNDQDGSVDIEITKADATCEVTAYDVTYDAAAHTATGSCEGVGGADLSADLDLSGTTHTAAGTYHGDPWSFTDTTGNYNDQDGTVDDNIDKADAECSIFNYHVTYDAAAHTATGWCTGVEDETLSGLDLSGTTHTAAGTYDGDAWSFTDTSGNYNDQDGTVDDLIDKADAPARSAATPASTTPTPTARAAPAPAWVARTRARWTWVTPSPTSPAEPRTGPSPATATTTTRTAASTSRSPRPMPLLDQRVLRRLRRRRPRCYRLL